MRYVGYTYGHEDRICRSPDSLPVDSQESVQGVTTYYCVSKRARIPFLCVVFLLIIYRQSRLDRWMFNIALMIGNRMPVLQKAGPDFMKQW